MERLFQIFDLDHDSYVDFKELMTGLSVLCRGSIEDRLRMCFQLFDRNQDGFVDRDELRSMLTSMYSLLSPSPIPASGPSTSETGNGSNESVRSPSSGGNTPEPVSRPPSEAGNRTPETKTETRPPDEASHDFSSEVAFFVDMLFRSADTNRDEVLSLDEFREAALLHPFILQTFNLDGAGQQIRQVRVSIGRSS